VYVCAGCLGMGERNLISWNRDQMQMNAYTKAGTPIQSGCTLRRARLAISVSGSMVYKYRYERKVGLCCDQETIWGTQKKGESTSKTEKSKNLLQCGWFVFA
jgi:uncharacterized ion transporter superfamily protein YfcC